LSINYAQNGLIKSFLVPSGPDLIHDLSDQDEGGDPEVDELPPEVLLESRLTAFH
jgi:hypothetical protein